MCGIAGILGAAPRLPRADLERAAGRMADRLFHRGPDSGGVWADEAAGIALAHRRLAIIDLTPEGAQPMHSKSGRFVMSFNGEIYNFEALRDELAALGHGFRGSSDTEVLLAAVEQWGFAAALERSNGMFAIALWDREERTLSLARDRMGEKPLYYGWCGDSFLFGSELKALRAHPEFSAEIDRDALALLVRHGYIAAPHSIHVGIRKLLPGGLLTLSTRRPREPQVAHYWSAQDAARKGVEHRFRGSAAEAVEELDVLLRDAVKLRMRADVPLGAFLSGGIDSSTVVALMQAQSARPVKTFTIGVREDGYDEAVHAKAVARHLGTEHTELYVRPEDALDVIPRLPALYDEPYADSSQIPTFLVSELTRRHVTVSLSGDAGDELFCGYQRYELDLFRRAVRWVPSRARALAASAVQAVPDAAWARALRFFRPVVPAALRGDRGVARLKNAAEMLKQPTAMGMYLRLVSICKDPSRLVPGSVEPPTLLTAGCDRLPTFTDEMMFVDALTYLPDDILVKVDRATMGVSLEARVPLLDHRVVEWAWRLPVGLKRREGTTKWVLRQVLYRHVPRELVERPKRGFSVPIDSWLRGPLREWAQDLLSEDRMRRDGYLDAAGVQTALRAHLSHASDSSYLLWNVLMFQAWLEDARGSARAAASGA